MSETRWFVEQVESDREEWGPGRSVYAPPSAEDMADDPEAEPVEMCHCIDPAVACRIVAAVNACAGISTADLEAGVVAELVEAVRGVDVLYAELIGGLTGTVNTPGFDEVQRAVGKARAVLAKLKGE